MITKINNQEIRCDNCQELAEIKKLESILCLDCYIETFENLPLENRFDWFQELDSINLLYAK